MSPSTRKGFTAVLVLFLVAAIAVGVIYATSRDFFSSLFEAGQSGIETIVQETDTFVEERISAPEPLRGIIDSRTSSLTVSGTISWTNTHRADTGLGALKSNTELTRAAEIKLADMFTHQYFEHVSPDGTDVGELARNAGYEFIAVGENLALGNYENDSVLVQAWMDSPGHRANILSDAYTEIGVAVGKGMFEGGETWLAVQEFGLPRSACPGPIEADRIKIEQNQAELEERGKELEVREKELEDTPRTSPDYNKKAREFNDLVKEYNALLEETKTFVDGYNDDVRAFNACAGA